MSSGGSAKLTMIIDFSGIDGSLMVAIAPENMTAEEADLKAKEIFESVRKAYDADYERYADGRFDTIQHMRDALEHIGAQIITWDTESYL
jgi:hypothetical protein